MSDIPYVDWDPIATGVYVAKSASVLSVEECPICKKAMETEPDVLGEIVCLGSHAFKVDDDGDSFSLTFTDAIRPKRASTSYEKQPDGAYVASLNANSFSCPMENCESPIDISEFGQKTASDKPLSVCCSQGHEFESYIRLPKIWMYESDAGPFDTSNKKIARGPMGGGVQSNCSECGFGLRHDNDTCANCGADNYRGEAGSTNCGICGEGIRTTGDIYNDEVGEFWDPKQPHMDSVLAHAQCGLNAGYEIA